MWAKIDYSAKLRSIKQNEVKAGLTPTDMSEEDLKEVYIRFRFRCFKCKTMRDLTVDHHLAKHFGYNLKFNNAVILCLSCNRAKGNKLPCEFYTNTQMQFLERWGLKNYLV
jgi:5-methylcytosine-specific restriction endonuclease McrA